MQLLNQIFGNTTEGSKCWLSINCYYVLLQSSDLIAYLKEQLDSKEKELFVIVSKEVEEKQLWMHHYCTQNSDQMAPQCDSPMDSVSSNSAHDYRNRDAQCLKLKDIRSSVIDTEESQFCLSMLALLLQTAYDHIAICVCSCIFIYCPNFNGFLIIYYEIYKQDVAFSVQLDLYLKKY